MSLYYLDLACCMGESILYMYPLSSHTSHNVSVIPHNDDNNMLSFQLLVLIQW